MPRDFRTGNLFEQPAPENSAPPSFYRTNEKGEIVDEKGNVVDAVGNIIKEARDSYFEKALATLKKQRPDELEEDLKEQARIEARLMRLKIEGPKKKLN